MSEAKIRNRNSRNKVSGWNRNIPGLKEALLAMTFFRARHSKSIRYGSRRAKKYLEMSRSRLIRDYIKKSRAKGFSGSILNYI